MTEEILINGKKITELSDMFFEYCKLKKENEELRKYQYKQEYLQSEIEKRQKALEEIREKCLKMCNICDNIDGETYLDDCNSICEYCKIIKLINEVIEDSEDEK